MYYCDCRFPLFFALVLLFTASIVAQEQPEVNFPGRSPEAPTPWTSMEFNNAPENFQFAIVTDRTGGHRPGVFLDGVRKLNLLQPEFVMSVGDLIEGYTEDRAELRRQWEEFDGFVDQLQMPFFYVPGNHDITNAVMDSVWRARYGATNYYFIYHDVLFLCLNSEDQYRGAGRGSISDDQREWIKKVLREHDQVRWTMVFMHQPLWVQETDPVRWQEVEALLAERQHTVFAGHRHHYVKYERNNGHYIMLATTGGGSALRGPELGEFDHVVWVTMTDQGPILANLQLEGIWDEDVVTERIQAYIDSLGRRQPLRIEPLYVDSERPFTGGKVRLRLTNDADVPMRVRLRDKFSWNLRSDLPLDQLEVAPNSVEFVELELAPRKSKAVGQFDAVPLSARIAYLAPDLPEVSYPLTYRVAPEPAYQLQRSGQPIEVDGRLEEWSVLPYSFSAPDAADMATRFDLRYDDDWLYLGIDVTDDDLQLDSQLVAWNQDFIGLVINGEPLFSSAMDQGTGWYRNSVFYTVTPATADLPNATYYEERLPADIRWACRARPGGYQLEFALPLHYLRERQGEDWKNARLNLIVQDWDAGEAEKPRYTWQPDWRSDENRVGSGMFFREGAGF